MTPLKRAAAALATSVLLTVGSAALAAPAHADVHVNVANLVGVDSNGTIDATVLGIELPGLPNVAAPII